MGPEESASQSRGSKPGEVLGAAAVEVAVAAAAAAAAEVVKALEGRLRAKAVACVIPTSAARENSAVLVAMRCLGRQAPPPGRNRATQGSQEAEGMEECRRAMESHEAITLGGSAAPC